MRYLIEVDRLNNFEAMDADLIGFTPSHITFTDSDGGLLLAYLASRVLSITPEAD